MHAQPDAPATSALSIDEAAQLLPVLATRVAAETGVRTLVIKGAVPAAHGLRDPRRSNDVDVLVEPAGFGRLCARMAELGWSGTTGDVRYAGALRHPIWPLELDLHRSFPGFVAGQDAVFEALWDERADLPAAGVDVPCAGWAGSVLIGALHALRRPVEGRNLDELRRLVRQVAAADRERSVRLRRLSAATGAVDTARPVLRFLDVPRDQVEARFDQCVRAWRADGGSPVRGVTWLLAPMGEPVRRWPGLLRRGLFGSGEAALRASYPDAPAGRRGLWRARWWRLCDVLPSLPAALRAVVGHRRIRRKWHRLPDSSEMKIPHSNF